MATCTAPATTWIEAVALEPRLADLAFEVSMLGITDQHPRFWHEYEKWKRKLKRLVGWDQPNPALRHCYDPCHKVLLDIFEGVDG